MWKEAAIMATISLVLTVVNIICILITATLVLKVTAYIFIFLYCFCHYLLGRTAETADAFLKCFNGYYEIAIVCS
jgi:hypothetical protein